MLTGFAPTSRIVRRFVAGETRDDVLTVAAGLLAGGRMISVDFLGENTTDRAQAQRTLAEYRELIWDLARVAPPAVAAVQPIEVSVKLSALGQALAVDGHAVATENLYALCAEAVRAGVWVCVDAEDHSTTEPTLATVEAMRTEFPWLGVAVQAYLRRTEADCRAFASAGTRIRLCKGAYREPQDVAFQRASEVTRSYLRCLEILMHGRGYPMIASHDPAVIAAAERMAADSDRAAGEFEHQMLYGVRDREQARLVHADQAVRVYVPYGGQWYGYLTRRLAERPANVAFFVRALRDGS
ncbi:proline dehydrogenase family protein [Nocardia sp. CNY236]|uniref:proline dehydrogenase family protein n=1 Tax=Nocardia sp. CNY236 TaxID=1169152 RepID=UPI0009DF1B28|nr:proline dehydrogenase family protein [Nocardia sp. CNY236]